MTRERQEQTELDEPQAGGESVAVAKPRPKRKRDLPPEEVIELQTRQRAIGRALRRIFDEVAREPVPKELLDLLRQIDGKRED